MTVYGRKSVEPVLEKFVGSNHQELQEIESDLKEIVNIVNERSGSLSDQLLQGKIKLNLVPDDINQSKFNKRIEANFKKFFKLKDFMLIWDIAAPNAMTPCKTFTILDRNIKIDDSGKHSNRKLTIGVVVTTGMITTAKLNEKELMAVILHEIGHNFYNSIFQILSRIPLTLGEMKFGLTKFKLMKSLPSLVVADVINMPTLYAKAMKTFELAISQFPLISKAVGIYRELYREIKDVYESYKEIKGVFKGSGFINIPFLLHYSRFTFSLKQIGRYNSEKHADSFATDYGYGVYLASSLDKMRTNEGSIIGKFYMIPGANWILDFMELQNEVIQPFMGLYPTDQNRIRTSLDRLKRNAKDPSLNPRLRKELDEQIAMYEHWYHTEFLGITDANQRRVFTWIYHILVEHIFAGKLDVRELTYALDPKKYK